MRKLSEHERAARDVAVIAKQQAVLAASTDVNRLTCLECGWHAMNTLQKHLERIHSLTPIQYYAKHAVGKEAIYAPKLRACLSENVKGEKNPAYQHGGKLSPFSTKFHKYATADEAKAGISAVGQKVRTAQLDHGNTKLKHYLNKGLTVVEAEQALKNRQQTFTLEKCVERHGADEGLRVWQERQASWQTTLNSKPIEEIEAINRRKIYKSGVSKISKELFSHLDRDGARHYGRDKELCIHLPGNKTAFIDFVFKHKAIEFFGTYWHADPRKYQPDSLIYASKKRVYEAQAIWKSDAERLQAIKDQGYDVLVIWEADYVADPAKTIQKCKNFLTS